MRIAGWLMAPSLMVAAWNSAQAQEPKAAAAAGVERDKALATSRKAVDLLVDYIRKHPAEPSEKQGQIPLYLIDARGGEATRIIVESQAGLNHNGSAVWSNDGRTLSFDASPPDSDYTRSRIKAIRLNEAGLLSTTDLGPGNCPEFSPDDEQILFLFNGGADSGVWIMNADGTGRKRIESYGRPRWAPDNSRILIIGFSVPHGITLIDVREGGESCDLQLAGRRFFSSPRWAGDGTIIATIGEGEEGDSVALIDVDDPDRCEVKEVLWKRSKELDVVPMASNLSTVTGRCVFVGKSAKGYALYGFDRGKPGPPTRLEPGAFDTYLRDPVFSPDGRYIVFSSDRPDRRKAFDQKAGRRP
jgi:Tol biopolymer transport system component